MSGISSWEVVDRCDLLEAEISTSLLIRAGHPNQFQTHGIDDDDDDDDDDYDYDGHVRHHESSTIIECSPYAHGETETERLIHGKRFDSSIHNCLQNNLFRALCNDSVL